MPVAWLYALASTVAVSLVSLVGIATIPISQSQLKAAISIMVSLAVGALLGDAAIHLLPEAFAKSENRVQTSLLLLAGMFAFFVLEKFLLWRHEHAPSSASHIQPVGYTILVSDGLHNLMDGMLIGASFLVDVPIGMATTLAVILHEIPQEIGDFGVLLQAGFSRSRALFFNFLCACLAIIGAVVALTIAEEVKGFSLLMLPLTAGGFTYIAGTDLIPELHQESSPLQSLTQFTVIGVGVGLMLLLLLLE